MVKSSLYRTAPVGYADQPDFVNAVAQLETGLPAERLLAELQEIEARHGRERSFPNAPRTLDLDLLLYGERDARSARADGPASAHARARVRAGAAARDRAASCRSSSGWHACKDQKVERID